MLLRFYSLVKVTFIIKIHIHKSNYMTSGRHFVQNPLINAFDFSIILTTTPKGSVHGVKNMHLF